LIIGLGFPLTDGPVAFGVWNGLEYGADNLPYAWLTFGELPDQKDAFFRLNADDDVGSRMRG